MKRNKSSIKNPTRAKKLIIAFVSAFIAVAIGITFALCFGLSANPVTVNDAQRGEAGQSARTLTDNLSGDQTAFGTLLAGDVINFTYSGGVRSITLPKGTYTLEVWGAQGGGGYCNGTFSAGTGYGGYTKGTWTATATTTLYIVIGGQGTNGLLGKKNTASVAAGGYNGGGNSGQEKNDDANDEGGGGGGATHIATTNRGVLSAYASYTSEVLIVAGGGGGTSFTRASGYGHGGGLVGGAGYGGSTAAGGGNTSTGAYGSAGTSGESGGNGTAGTFGQGGIGGNGTSGGGGGGGGWRGGGGAGVGGNGGGGSGYYASSLTSPSSSNGQQTGNGKARITVDSVNLAPRAKSNTTQTVATGLTLGVAGTKTVSASDFAEDPDTSKTSLAFTNGTASNLDTFTTTANTGLFLDSACTVSASTYFNWTWPSTSQFTISLFKMYPRNGTYSSANGTLNLYARVRDTFTSDSTNAVKQRGWAVIAFRLSVNKPTGAAITTATDKGSYIVGNSNTTTAPAMTTSTVATTSSIYNPNGSSRYTAICKTPLTINQSFTLKAADLLTGNFSSGTTYLAAVMSLTNTTNCVSTNTARAYKVNDLDNSTNKVTAYTTGKAAITNAFTQITITCLNPNSGWHVLPVTLYVTEKASAYGSSYPYCVPDVTAVGMDIVFRLDNSRPYLKSTAVFDLAVGATGTLSLGTYIQDADASTISTSTHKITEVIVPQQEFIQLNRYDTIVSTNAGNYNVGTKQSNSITTGRTATNTNFNTAIAYNATAGGSDTSNTAFMKYTYTGITLTVTGLRSSFSQYLSTRTAALGHFYLLLHIQDLRETGDTGIWAPIAFRVGYSESYTPTATITSPYLGATTKTTNYTGQTASSVMPVASGTVGKSFYFAPMAINYGTSQVIGKYKTEDASGNNTGALTSTSLQPLAIDGDNFAATSGLASWNGSKLNEFLQISSASTPTAIVQSMSSVGFGSDSTSAWNNYIKVSYLDVYVDSSYLASATYSGGRVIAGSGTTSDNGYKYAGLGSTVTVEGKSYYVIKGLKITLRAATMNRYFAASVTVADTTSKSVSVNIAVRVNNTAPTAVQGRTDVANPVAVATYSDAKNANAYSTYAYDPNNSNVSARVTVPTFTYKIPLYGNVIITPYDFVSDYNINMAFGSTTDFSSRGGFTLNGLSGNYSSGLLDFSTGSSVKGLFDKSKYASTTYISALGTYLNAVTNTKASVSKVGTAYSSSATFSAANVYNDKLFFARSSGGTDAYTYNPVTTDFVVSQSNTTGFVSSNYGSKVKIGSSTYEVDFILLTGVTRTTQPAVIELTVRDRYGNSSDGVASFTVRIVVEVVNTAPNIKNVNRYEELAVTPVTVSGKVYPDVYSFGSNGNDALTGLMEDYDKDTPEFVTARGTIVANTKNLATIYPELTSFSEVGSQYLTDDGTASGRLLTEYVTSALVTRFELTANALSSTKAIACGVYVYFFASDGNGGITLGYVQIEVVNTAPILNTEDDGFDGTDPLWAVESTSEADIARNRYIVGSVEAWNSIKQINGAIDNDIRLISTDADGLHSKTTLAPIGVQTSGQKHVNLVVPTDKNTAITEAALEKAVPKLAIAKSFAAGADPDPVAVIVYTTVTAANGQKSEEATLPADKLQTQILFLHNNMWVTRSELITALTGKKIAEMSEYFDEKGRFISTDWAVNLQASVGFASNKRLSIKLSLRDEVVFGGDTAGEATAYAPLRSTGNKTAVDGAFTPTVHYFVSQTGIRTKDEYTLNYNDYYVVESNGSAYVSTYDGKTGSLYTADDNTSNITYNESDGTRVLAANGSVNIKERAEGAADGTLAGTNSGKAYSANTIDNVAGAYKYPSVIEIPASGEYVYIPMSYFGLLQDLVGVESSVSSETRGKVIYLDEYVGYDVGSAELVRSNIANFASAITLSDGVDSWTGSDLLNNNSSHPQPYLEIKAFDDYKKDGSTSSAAKFESELSKPYYNNRLAVPTTNSANELIGYEYYAANRNSFVADGEIMYLEEQAKYLQEHNFGLAIRKSDMRTGLRNLTLTIKLAKSSGDRNVVPENDEDEAQLKRIVTVNIHIENSKIDLAVDNGTDVKFDGKTYYMDITMATATSQSFALSRLNGNGNVETISDDYKDVSKIAYTDDDYSNAAYRDKAYFLADSFIALKRWSLGASAYNRVMTPTDDGDALRYTTMGGEGTANRAQSSLANYFGVEDVSDISSVNLEKYQPNGGMYGSNSNGNENGYEGYSSYFSASLSEGGRVINIMSSHQTFINEIALERYLNVETMTQADVIVLYKARGLVAEYADETVDPATPTRVYYPFKTLIYDSCGVGFGDASYVSIELRIEITNATPSLKKVGDEVTDVSGNVTGREYKFNLAVGNSVTINLYDLISDADMFVEGTKGYYTLATKTQFEEDAVGVNLETGDYLASPYMYDEYLRGTKTLYDTAYPNADGTYYRDGGGLSVMGEDTKDVVMWMETRGVTTASTSVEPRTNNLSFTVHRRSTAEVASDGARNVSVNEYRFTLKFYDSYGEQTQYFTFIINITNSAPVITAETRSFTMRSGDDLTVLTTYYDNFIGNGDGNNSNGSTAYRNSATRTYYDNRKAQSGYGETFGDGENNATSGDKTFWLFSDIMSDYKNEIIYNTTVGEIAERKNVHLGYLGLANDDTPWRMRIVDIDYDGNSGLTIETNFSLDVEGTSASEASFMAIDIRARGTCVNEPVTITLSDGENGNVTCVLYFTVVSTPPEALDYNNLADKKLIDEAGLEPEKADNGEYKSGVYRLFTVPTGEAKVEVENFEGEVKTARSSYTISMKNVAKDPDGDSETSGMTLYGDGFFTVNDDTVLVKGNDGAYHADYFTIRVAEGNNKSFTITATGYNPNSENGYEKLTFLVADDYGKGGFEKAIEITINIYTMYSDMTNPAVAAMGVSSTAYNSYMGGANSVHVKSYDEYCSSAVLNPSKYAFVSLKGNVGTDGNTTSPIIDPDATNVGEQAYTARLYAFIDGDANKNNFAPLSAATLKSMFKTDSAKKTFMLDKSKSGTDYSEYMIGGVSYNGTALRVDSSAALRLSYVRQFVEFGFAENGSALILTPNAATLNNNIILYVEAEKYIDEGRGYKRTDAVLTAGELFKLVVEDSAPNAVKDASVNEFADYDQVASGSAFKGDETTPAENIISFKIFDSESSLASLFADSDKGDYVTVKSISDKDYEEKILKKALKENPNLDWAASQGKPRAFDIEINSETNTLNIKINRRIDEFKNGKYSESVSFPIEIEGVDLGGKTATGTILLTIRNSNVKVNTDSYSKYDSETGIGYTLSQSFGDNRRVSYNIDARVKYSHALEIDIFDFISDCDYSTTADMDSFRFEEYVDVYPYEYITDKTQTVYWYETNSSGGINTNKFKELATVEPLGNDQWHMSGVRITALDTSRTLSGKTYIRILDRSASKDGDAGVFITLNITVMNDAPYVISGMESTSVIMLGSDKATPNGLLFNIGDFVDDINDSDVVGDSKSANSETYLRIFSQQALALGGIYSRKYSNTVGTGEDATGSSLFTVTVPRVLPEDLLNDYLDRNGLDASFKDTSNEYNQWFVVTPIEGYYGNSAVEITVADGDLYTHTDTLTTTFRINVSVVYDPEEMSNVLNPIKIACSKTRTLDIDALMPALENKLTDETAGVVTSASGNAFSQAEYYILTYVDLQNTADSIYGTFEHVGTSGEWTLTAGKQVTFDPVRVNVRYALISDPSKVYSKYFWLTVVANQAPTCKFDEITFTRYHRTGDTLRDLSDSNSVSLEAWQLFKDEDDPEGSSLRYISAKSSVPSIVSVTLSADKRYLMINFAARGEADITVEVTDETGTPIPLTFTVRNDDLPEGSLWMRISASFEANTAVWVIIICVVVVLIIVLMIVLAVLRKRKRDREELEALLVSEMEIEDTMLKLAGAPSPTDYQSFGYLQSGMPMDQNNGMMLGAGLSEPATAQVTDLTPPMPEDGGEIPPTDIPPTDGSM